MESFWEELRKKASYRRWKWVPPGKWIENLIYYYYNFKINRLTIWSIYEDDEPVPIKSVHRKNCNFCVGADLDDTDEEEVVLEDGNINVKKQKVSYWFFRG